MENVKVNKVNLLTILKENRAKHLSVFEEAMKGYRAEVIKLLDRAITLARAGKEIITIFNLQRPMNQSSDYDRAIRMLEMSVEENIEISEGDFENYVLDKWHWSEQFSSTSSSYSSSSSAMSSR